MLICDSMGLSTGIHLGKQLCVHVGKGSRVGQVWKKKPDNWPKGRQRPGRTALYKRLNHLFTALLLLSREDVHTLSLCFASSSSKHIVSLFSLPLVVLCL